MENSIFSKFQKARTHLIIKQRNDKRLASAGGAVLRELKRADGIIRPDAALALVVQATENIECVIREETKDGQGT